MKNKTSNNDAYMVENVILHLDCSLDNLDKNTDDQLEHFHINNTKKGLLNSNPFSFLYLLGKWEMRIHIEK